MSAANEIAVESFLQNRLKFARIPDVVQQAMESHVPDMTPTMESIADADREGRARAVEAVRKMNA
jgi:1-deoxy-D-xylulose-5-phosphate reductoisomerase